MSKAIGVFAMMALIVALIGIWLRFAPITTEAVTAAEVQSLSNAVSPFELTLKNGKALPDAPGFKVDILFFFLTITVGVVAIWLLFQNLTVVIWVTAAWLVLFVIELPREANVAHSFVAKLRKVIDPTGVDSSSNAANKAGRVGKDGVRRPATGSKPTPAAGAGVASSAGRNT